MQEVSEYIVSARKYRPQTFRSVVGQRHITETLRNAIANNQMAHAYLFTGPRGVGKTTCARIFARSINCLNPSSEHEACGVCESCVAFAKDRSFNIHEMDAASNNSVDDIRMLNDKVRVAPQIGKYSVYIIDEVHMLSAAAFNAFLKTLEEPPAHAIFVLATTEKHKILPTILSRCQIYDFKRIRVEDIVDYLRYIAGQEGVTSDDESLYIIAQKADGGMRDALSTFDRVVSFCGSTLRFEEVSECVGALDYNTYFMAVEMAQSGNYSDLLMLYDSILTKGLDGQHFLSGFAEHLRNLLVAKSPQTLPLLELSGSLAQRYGSQAAMLDIAFLFSAVNLLSTADATYRTATSRRLHVELTLMKLSGLAPVNAAPAINRSVLPKVDGGVVAQQPTPQAQPQQVVQSQHAPAPAPVSVQSSAPSVQQVVQQPVVTPQPQSSVQQPQSPQPAVQHPIGGSSMFGLSINAPSHQSEDEKKNDQPLANTSAFSLEEGCSLLKSRFGELVSLWEQKGKPRTAMALATAIIELQRIVVFVPNDIMESEIINSKIDLESDMQKLFNYRLPIEVVVKEENIVERPITIGQRIEHLAEKNPNLLKLREALDLTV